MTDFSSPSSPPPGAAYPPPPGQGVPPPATDWRSFLNSLRRDPEHGWIAGICAGLAQNLGLLPSVVRAGFVILFFLLDKLLDSGEVLIFAYAILWIGLPTVGFGPALRWPGFGRSPGPTTAPWPQPGSGQGGAAVSPADGRPRPSAAEVRLRLLSLDQRLAAMEDSVTSGAFALHRQFAGLRPTGDGRDRGAQPGPAGVSLGKGE